MKNRHAKKLAAGLGALLIAGAFAIAPAEDSKPDDATAKAFADAIARMSAPAPEHARYEPLIGSWNYEMAFNMPGMPPIRAEGTAVNEWIMGGRFVRNVQKTGEGAAWPVESMTVFGYDTRFKKHTMWGIDTMGTYSVSAEGGADAYDAEANSITMTGWNEEPEIGKIEFRWVVTIEGDDAHRQEIFFKGQDGQWPDKPMVRVDYARRK